jgi:carbamoyl-phosphate synthase small subunit
MLSTVSADEGELVERARALPEMSGLDLARTVTTPRRYTWDEPTYHLSGEDRRRAEARFHVVAYDFGIKRNVLRGLVDAGCRVTVVPAGTGSDEVQRLQPDGIFLSNGPGDPEPCGYAVKAVQELLGRTPIFGVCLGHQILGLALGGRTFKLKFGHHGGNHPVQHVAGGQVEITAQNHGFAVDADSLAQGDVEATHVNLNDGTLEGLRHRSLPAFSVQYHPEASPGPHDSQYLFGEFTKMMEQGAA